MAWIETLYTSNIKKSVDVKDDDDDGDDGENDDDYENDDDIWWCTFRLRTNEQVIPQVF